MVLRASERAPGFVTRVRGMALVPLLSLRGPRPPRSMVKHGAVPDPAPSREPHPREVLYRVLRFRVRDAGLARQRRRVKLDETCSGALLATSALIRVRVRSGRRSRAAPQPTTAFRARRLVCKEISLMSDLRGAPRR